MSNTLEAPEALLAAHDRLRQSGFPVVSVICARTLLDARVWFGQWAAALGRAIVLVPEPVADAALAAYAVRVPAFSSKGSEALARALPILLLPGDLRISLPTALTLIEEAKMLPVALTCGIAGFVEHLLDTGVPMPLVSATLQGLVPVAQTEQQVLKKVAEGRQVIPFLRGACEGLVFYMLEARPETRGRFETNKRVTGARGRYTYEVDIICTEAKLIIEIDGSEHNQSRRRTLDEQKHLDLEDNGYRVRRFSNEQVISDPVSVWQLIAEQLTLKSKA